MSGNEALIAVSDLLKVLQEDNKQQIALLARLEANQEGQKDKLNSLHDDIREINKIDEKQTKDIITLYSQGKQLSDTLEIIVNKLQDKPKEELTEKIALAKIKWGQVSAIIAAVGTIITAILEKLDVINII